MLLLPFADCSGPGPFSRAFPADEVSVTVPSVRDVIDSGDGGLIVLSNSVEPMGGSAIARIGGGTEEQVAAIPPGTYTPGETLFLTGPGHWWYVRSDRKGFKSSLYFVTSGAAGVTQKKIELRPRILLWVPLRGDQPTGIVLSFGDDPSSFFVDEVSEAGARPLGSYPGHLPGTAPMPGDWSAERLPDGRIALLSIEQSVGSPWRFMLRVFDGKGGVAESSLPCADQLRESLSTAMERGGRIAALALSPKGEVVTMSVNVDDPADSHCRILSGPGETAVRGSLGSPSLASADGELVAAWIRNDGTVRACQLGNRASAPAVVDVGKDAKTVATLAHLVSFDGNGMVTFTWKTDRGIVMRRVPRTLEGYALILEIERFCYERLALLLA